VKAVNYLGIYLGKGKATAVCLSGEGAGHRVLGCFTVEAEESASQGAGGLAGLIAQECISRQVEFSESAVALNCSMFMQHNIKSEFGNLKQIAATIRFDTEEALAMDISELAIAFKVISTDETGSALTVFTAQKRILSEVLTSLQANNIDPLTAESDVNCLCRFLSRKAKLPEGSSTLFGILSRRNAYFVGLSDSGQTLALRTFLVALTQDREGLLSRELPVTSALIKAERPISRLGVYDSTGSVNNERLSKKLCMQVCPVDLLEAAGVDGGTLSDDIDPVDFAIAYGAALSNLEKDRSANFREDFLPYQGKKVRLLKTLKTAGIAAAAFMLVLGIYLQLQLFGKNRDINRLREKFQNQYSAVMFGKKLPGKSKDAVRALGGELRRIENVKQGLLSVTGEESVSAKLTVVLEAFNKCAAQTDLNVDSISVTTRNIVISGDTSSRRNTLKLFDAIKEQMNIVQQRLDTKGGRDNFSITVMPKDRQ
jgi:hypothetical protein